MGEPQHERRRLRIQVRLVLARLGSGGAWSESRCTLGGRECLEAVVGLGRGDGGGRGKGLERNQRSRMSLGASPMPSSLLAIEWNFTHIPEGILQFRVS